MRGAYIASVVVALSGTVHANNVLFTSTGDPTLDALTVSTLSAAGHSATAGPRYYDFDGSQSLAGYDAFLLLMNTNWSADMPTAGQQVLLNFVSSGRELVTGEWVVWANASHGALNTLYPAVPVVSTTTFNYVSPITYSQVTPDPVLNAGLPALLTFVADNFSGTETQFDPKPGATIYYDSDNLGSGVIGWQYGSGRVFSFSTTLGPQELQDVNYGRLLGNVFDFSSVPSLCPGDADCDGQRGFGDIDLFVAAIPDNQSAWAALYAARHGGAQPLCPFLNNDCTGDGHVNFADIDAFVALIPSACP